MQGICPLCSYEGKLTKDHIIPTWLYKRLQLFDIDMTKNLGKKNIQWICSNCNNKKGPRIDFNHPLLVELDLKNKLIKYLENN